MEKDPRYHDPTLSETDQGNMERLNDTFVWSDILPSKNLYPGAQKTDGSLI